MACLLPWPHTVMGTVMRRIATQLLTVAAAAALLAGCGETVRSYSYEEHAIRIDRTSGDANARVYVDECAVDGLYYDRSQRQWGVEGYTYGASYWALDELAQDMASWGAAECGSAATHPDEPTPAPSGADGLAAR